MRPGLVVINTFIEPQRGGTPLSQTNARAESAAPTELLFFCLHVPRVSFRALPSFHPGLCRSIVPTALVISLNFDALALGSYYNWSIHLERYVFVGLVRKLIKECLRAVYRLVKLGA